MSSNPELETWERQLPPVMVPTPITDLSTSPAGRRVIVRRAEFTMSDLRAVSGVFSAPADDGGYEEQRVRVIGEQGWFIEQYERERGIPLSRRHEFPTADIAVDRIWVEDYIDAFSTPPERVDDTPAAVVAEPTSPGVQWPVRAREVSRVVGARAVAITPEGVRTDLRVLSGPHPVADGGTRLVVCEERAFYVHGLLLRVDLPDRWNVNTEHVWIT